MGRTGGCPPARWLPAGSTCAPGQALPQESAGFHEPGASLRSAPPSKWRAPQKPKTLLEGFCPEPRHEEQIAVNSNGLMLFLRLADIEWVQAAGSWVELHVGQKTHLLRATLSAVATKLPPDRFLSISPSMLVNIEQIKELRPMLDGECELLLRNGMRLILACGYGGNLLQIPLSLPSPMQTSICPRFILGTPARRRMPAASRR